MMKTSTGLHLREMLEAVVSRRRARAARARSDGTLPVISVSSAAEILREPIQPLWRLRVDAAAADGPMESLYASIREEGWRAYAEGGIEAMHELEGKACGSNAYFYVIVDHRWDGIGTKKGGFWVT